jgi:hypothetical protein
MVLELAEQLEINVKTQDIVDWLYVFKNDDGGFGTHGHSNINSTYYATSSMLLLKQNPKKLNEMLKFVRAWEKPGGGFTVIPINLMPYMEYTYYGIMTLDLLGQKSKYPSQTKDWVLSCQNNNGGFARSDLGISTFVDTYYAIKLLQKLE